MQINLEQTHQLGMDSGRGNLLGVQPWLTPADYTSAATLESKLSAYLEAARQKEWLNLRTVVVFPEYSAAWLAIANGPPGSVSAKTSAAALRTLAINQPLAFVRSLLRSSEKDRATAALFRMRAVKTARLAVEVFSNLARRYQVTVLGGTLICNEPRVDRSVLFLDPGKLYNTALVFRPDGSLHPQVTRKVHPIAGEQDFCAAEQAASLPLYETPAGRMMVLICADSWYPDCWARVREGGAELVAVPSLLTGNDLWEKPWRGYSGAAAPADVDPADQARLSEGQAWRRYALAGRFPASGARAGINVFFHGEMWDLGSNSGLSMMCAGGEVVETTSTRATLLNCWL